MSLLSGSFTATGQSSATRLPGPATASLFFDGATATVALQRKHTDDADWRTVETYSDDEEFVIDALEFDGYDYRFSCTAFTSGEVEYRIG